MANSGITKIEFINKGFEEILSSEGCRQVVEDATNEIGDLANENNTRGGKGFATNVVYGRAKRYIGFVSTTDDKSEQAESEEGALTRAKEGFIL